MRSTRPSERRSSASSESGRKLVRAHNGSRTGLHPAWRQAAGHGRVREPCGWPDNQCQGARHWPGVRVRRPDVTRRSRAISPVLSPAANRPAASSRNRSRQCCSAGVSPLPIPHTPRHTPATSRRRASVSTSSTWLVPQLLPKPDLRYDRSSIWRSGGWVLPPFPGCSTGTVGQGRQAAAPASPLPFPTARTSAKSGAEPGLHGGRVIRETLRSQPLARHLKQGNHLTLPLRLVRLAGIFQLLPKAQCPDQVAGTNL
jgi:hypothetical protein